MAFNECWHVAASTISSRPADQQHFTIRDGSICGRSTLDKDDFNTNGWHAYRSTNARHVHGGWTWFTGIFSGCEASKDISDARADCGQ